MLLGCEMSQKSNVTLEHPLCECSLDWNLRKMVHCVCPKAVEGKRGKLLFLGQFVHGRTLGSGSSPGPTFALCCLCGVVDAFAAHKVKVAGLNPYFPCDDS